MIFTVA